MGMLIVGAASAGVAVGPEQANYPEAMVRGWSGRALRDSHKSPEFPAVMHGFEAEEALEGDDRSWLAVVAGPSAEARADPGRVCQCRFGVRVLLPIGLA